MDAVMPPLINAASEENYFEVTNEEEDEEEEDDDDVATFQVGDKSLSIRISALEEKATACNMLRCYADELKEGFSRCGDAACMQRRRRLLLHRSRSRRRYTLSCIAPPLSVSGGLRGQQRSWSLSSSSSAGRTCEWRQPTASIPCCGLQSSQWRSSSRAHQRTPASGCSRTCGRTSWPRRSTSPRSSTAWPPLSVKLSTFCRRLSTLPISDSPNPIHFPFNFSTISTYMLAICPHVLCRSLSCPSLVSLSLSIYLSIYLSISPSLPLSPPPPLSLSLSLSLTHTHTHTHTLQLINRHLRSPWDRDGGSFTEAAGMEQQPRA